MQDRTQDQKVARSRQVLAGVVFGGLVAGAAAIGTIMMKRRNQPDTLWFRALRKPKIQPPDKVFGPVWSVLYPMIAYSGYRVWKAAPSRTRTAALALWGTQLALNGAWTPLFFVARRPKLALADIALLDAAAGAYAALAKRVDTRATASFVPYLAWLSFATLLNGKIVAKNPDVLLK